MDQQTDFYALYTAIFQKNGLDHYIKDDLIRKFEQLTDLMLKTNAVMNVTALTTLEKIIPLHYADCVAVAHVIPLNATVMDIGCGGGFPILPLAIVRPDLHLIGVDSTEKKVKYVQETAEKLGLSIQTMAARAEDLGKDPRHRECYDVVISRAVARMNVLDELALPLVKVGGQFIAMKGAAGEEEALEAQIGCSRLGGGTIQIDAYDLHTGPDSESRTLLTVHKHAPTPPAFPRSFGQIKKKPL